jgi:ATP-binding cassette subfamily B protein
VVGAVGDLVRLAGIIILMVTLEPRLAALTFVGLPPVAVLLVVLRRYYRDAFREIRAKTARMNATMNEQVAGITVVQSFRREGAAQREFDEINGAYRDANIRAIKYEAMQDAAIDCIAAICIASMMVYVGYAPVSFGTLVAFNVYVFQFFEPISTLSQRYTLLQSALAGAERIFGLMDVRGEEDAPRTSAASSAARSSAAAPAPTQSPLASNPAGHGAAVTSAVTSALAFEHVTFRYKPGRAVLEDVDFSVARGEKVALVGPTGSGKSTITALLLRLYDVRDGEGRVTVAGRDVRDYERHDLRTRFSVVPQDVFLFPGSLASNVAFSEHPDEARVKEVLERIGALDLFQRRPDGVRAKVTERGSNFSAGERQLIAFARALYRDSDVLILDEATASVDSDTEARLQRALETLLTDRTAIVIAHRLATIRKADRILVLKQGHIVEQGDHEALLAHGGLYARLHALQSAAESHGLVGAAE